MNNGGQKTPLVKELELSDAVVIAASKQQDHAEIAARDFRNDELLQMQTLDGGVIEKVNSAVTTNGICKPVCAGAFNTYVGDPSKRSVPGDNGFVENINLDATTVPELREEYFPGSSASDVRASMVAFRVAAQAAELDAAAEAGD